MNYTKDVGGIIDLDTEAKKWTKNFRVANPTVAKAYFIGANIINEILDQEECVGIRVYNALDAQGKPQAVFVGVDDQGKDMVNGIVADRCYPCPNECDTSSPLS